MSNPDKYPNDRNLETVDGLDHDLDVPTYRKLADSETTEMPRPQYDAYAAAGRSKPQVIEPDTADQPTAVFPTAETEQPAPAAAYSEPAPTAASEPAPTMAPAAPVAAPAATPVAVEPETQYVAAAAEEDPDFVDGDQEHAAEDPRRGTTNFGLLLLRLGVGAMLIVHGVTTLFGLANSGGVSALQADFAANGFNFAEVLGIAVPTVQMIAGVLLVIGLATPLAAGLALALSAYLTMYEVASSGTGWNLLGAQAAAVQLQLLLTAAALALQFTGPGRLGVDYARNWARRPLVSSWVFLILGVAAAVVLWYFTAGSWPFMR